MDLYLGAPVAHLHPTGPGYALAHEMTNNTVIEKYRPLNKLILDNGADELGTGQGGMRLAYLTGRLQPNFLILPDVLHKDKTTREKGEAFYEEMKSSGYQGKYMGVIQSKSLKKALESYEWWAKSGIVDRIGITYDTQVPNRYYPEWKWGGRLNLLVNIWESKVYKRNPMGVHLLGTLDVHELFILSHWVEFSEMFSTMVESHDTTMPYACDTLFEVGGSSIELGRKKDYPKLDFKQTFDRDRLAVAEFNVAAYLAACKVSPDDWSHYLGDKATSLFGVFQRFYD
jgi:hypothetical protein